MNKVLVIGRSNSGSKNNPIALASAFKADFADLDDLRFAIGEQEFYVKTLDHDLSDYSLVIFVGWYTNKKGIYYKDIAFAAAIYCQNKGVDVWNSEVLQQRSTTKLSAMMVLHTGGVSVPQTWFSVKKDWYKNILDGGNKFVYKAIAASRGDSNFLVESFKDVSINAPETACMMVQEYIPNTYDLRLVCANSVPVYVLKRSSTDDSHKNNTSLGGSAEQVDLGSLDYKVVAIASKSATLLARELGGVDLIYSQDKDKYLCLEVNPLPQLTSGTNIDHKLQSISEAIENHIEKKEEA